MRFSAMLLLVVICGSVLLLAASCGATEDDVTQEEATQEDITTEETTAPEEQILLCQEEQATAGMNEEQREAYMVDVGQEAWSRSFSEYTTVPPEGLQGTVSQQDVLAERGYDCGWAEYKAKTGR
jgi:hypothetical protein